MVILLLVSLYPACAEQASPAERVGGLLSLSLSLSLHFRPLLNLWGVPQPLQPPRRCSTGPSMLGLKIMVVVRGLVRLVPAVAAAMYKHYFFGPSTLQN